MKNLWWKEWRETRGLLIAGTAAVMGIFVVRVVSDLWGVGKVVAAAWEGTMASFLLILPMFAALSAAGRFAGEAQTGTLAFLLAQPISRWRVWFVKASVALLSVIPLGVLAVLLYFAVLKFLSHDNPYPDMTLNLFPVREGLRTEDIPICGSGAAATLVVIPLTLLLSALLDKPSLSALGGLAGTAAVLMWAMRTAQWMFRRNDDLSVLTWGEAGVAWTLMLTIGALCLAGSAMVFTRRGMRRKMVAQSDGLRYAKAGD